MAIDTFHPKRTEKEKIRRSIFMTGKAIGSNMGADQREPASLMNLRDIVNDPGIGRMTPGAIISHRLVMHIGVAGNAFCPGFDKIKRCMASPATDSLVLPCQGEFRSAVIE